MKRATCLLLLFGMLLCPFPVQTAIADEQAPNALRLELFIRSDAENCRAAEQFARELAARRGGIDVEVYDLVHDQEALARYWVLMKKFQVPTPALPAYHACGKLTVGFGNAKDSGPAMEALFDIHAYVREGCPHCRDAKRFLAGLAARWPGIQVRYHDIIRDPGAHQRMTELAQRAKKTVTGMPVISVCGQVVVGYQSDATTGRQIEDSLRKAAVAPPARQSPKAREGASWHSWRRLAVATGFAALTPSIVPIARGENAMESRTPGEDVPAGEDSSLPPLLPESTTNAPIVYEPAPERPQAQIEVPWLGTLRVDEWGLPAFTFLVGLIDGFNPCAMWVLVFLLSVLVNVRSRLRILAVAGTFVLVSGLAYYAFMAAWMHTFLLVGVARPLQIALGLLGIVIGAVNIKDFFAFKAGLSLSIPESAKPGIYSRVRGIVSARYLSVAVGAAVTLAVMVNMVELLCTAGLPALYTQVLSLQQLPTWQNHLYLGLYILAYMLDDALLLGVFVVTLSRRKLQEREGRWLKLLSGLVILALSAVLLFRPDWLYWGAPAAAD